MTLLIRRRKLILAAAVAPWVLAYAEKRVASIANAATLSHTGVEAGPETNSPVSKLAALEQATGGRLGVFAFSSPQGKSLSYRAQERFPVTSTFKVMLAAAILRHSDKVPTLQATRIHYAREALVAYSPITEKHVATGMTVAELCAAALQYSDNSAANLLMKILGGPGAVTAFARSIGNQDFRLDRWETALNTAIPGDVRDTSTPSAMAHSLHALTVGNALPAAQRQQLQAWLCGNKTGVLRIKAGIPADWKIGDKTGSGDYGTTNDVAVLWPPAGRPIVLAIFFTQREPDAKWDNTTIARAARIAVQSMQVASRGD